MNELPVKVWAWLDQVAVSPLAEFYDGLHGGDRVILLVLVAIAAAAGFILRGAPRPRGRRRRSMRIGKWGSPVTFQNEGELRVSAHLGVHFRPPAYHLMNHVTLRMDDGTTQVDHVLVSRFGVFVIETKHYTGWIFANADGPNWTQVRFRARFKFQNPILQNARHVRAVRDVLDFLPPDVVKSLVVFTGDAEFKTEIPRGVLTIAELEPYLKAHTEEVLSQNQLQFCVGRLETVRLAISRETDVEHVESLARRHGRASA